MHLGMHFSIAGGFHRAVLRAVHLGCSAVQIFVQNPRSWRWRPVAAAEAGRFRNERRHLGIRVAVAHLSYLPNLAAADGALYQRSWERLQAELAVAKALELDYVVCHPGHAADESGSRRLAAGLQQTVRLSPPPPLIVLENTAGQKHELGADLAELVNVLTSCQVPLGLCLDTAHAYAAGYDFCAGGLERLEQELAAGPGLAALKLIHLNDSRFPCGSRRDRHWHLGQGAIGSRGLERFLRRFAGRAAAVILETPKQAPEDDAHNLTKARELMAGLGGGTSGVPLPGPDPGSDGGLDR